MLLKRATSDSILITGRSRVDRERTASGQSAESAEYLTPDESLHGSPKSPASDPISPSRSAIRRTLFDTQHDPSGDESGDEYEDDDESASMHDHGRSPHPRGSRRIDGKSNNDRADTIPRLRRHVSYSDEVEHRIKKSDSALTMTNDTESIADSKTTNYMFSIADTPPLTPSSTNRSDLEIPPFVHKDVPPLIPQSSATISTASISAPLVRTLSSTTSLSSTRSQREREEWSAMLSSVMSGEVVTSEKKRLSTWLISNTQQHADDRTRLWLSLKAHLAGRTVEEERCRLEDKRAKVDKLLQEVMDFTVKLDPSSPPPHDQVAAILARVDRAEALYPSRHAFITQTPMYGSGAFQHQLDALISWAAVSKAIRIKLAILKEWTGSELMEESLNEEVKLERSSFVDMVLKNAGVKIVFTTGVLRTLQKLLVKCKTVMTENSQVYKRLGLSMFSRELERLAAFPSDLMQEFLKARLAYCGALTSLSGSVADQVIEDIAENIQLAISLHQDARHFYQPTFGWTISNCLSTHYETHLLETFKLYLKLLAVRSERLSESMLLPLTEQLEAQWEFAKSICHGIHGADMECAIQFCTMETNLLQYAVKQMEIYSSRVVSQQTEAAFKAAFKSHHRLLDDTRSAVWAILRLLKSLEASICNAVEYQILDVGLLVHQLVQTGHSWVEFIGANPVTDMIVFASPNTQSANVVTSVLDTCVCDAANPETPHEFGYYCVILPISPQQLEWNGRVIQVHSYDIPETLLRTGHGLVVAESVDHVDDSRLRFENGAGESVVVCSEPRPFHSGPQIGLSGCRKSLVRLLHRVKSLTGEIRQTINTVENTAQFDADPRLTTSDVIGDWFCFVAEMSQKALKCMTYPQSSITMMLNSLLVELVGDWVDFCIRDCDSKSRRTLRWCLQALEFAQVVVAGGRIDHLKSVEFSQLRACVARAMSLLIKFIDVQGVRSQPRPLVPTGSKSSSGIDGSNVISPDPLPVDALTPLTSYGSNGDSSTSGGASVGSASDNTLVIKNFDLDTSPSRRLGKSFVDVVCKIEDERSRRETGWRMVGKVLDDVSSERDRALKQIVSESPQLMFNWQQGKFLGGGSYGTVSVAINLDTSDLMAVKEIHFSDSKSLSTLEKSVREEMAVLRQLSHPNTVEYYGVEVRRDRLYIFMEYCPQCLATILDHGRIEDEGAVRVYVKQMLKGLEYLHSKGIVHRDIKPANLLIGSNGQIKYVDFGASKIYKSTMTIQNGRSLVGTANYLAPEVITGDVAGAMGAQDIWSLGCCVLEMISGKKPWSNLDNDWAVMYHIGISNCNPPLPGPDQMSRECRDFLLKCFTRPASARPTVAALLKHPWVINIDDGEYEITMTPTVRAVGSEYLDPSGSTLHRIPSKRLLTDSSRRASFHYDSDEGRIEEIRGKKGIIAPPNEVPTLTSASSSTAYSNGESSFGMPGHRHRFNRQVPPGTSLSLPPRAESAFAMTDRPSPLSEGARSFTRLGSACSSASGSGAPSVSGEP
ncbi:hypothetical protein SmJEL517_g01045 [Synchytrium microbalum]|uniref:Protein kinase domain-containing protein n=1 Tax=Synchytrium microbalum TaxID=1806994 RepID=A0A507C7H5_9FUNG|nr:uncharacterized protein SmJEL517_g01045 [Synchytrium microbalum]TPX36997.1 hypothetical protein SmJEL517_g01045 [Synchytrium microbalum]